MRVGSGVQEEKGEAVSVMEKPDAMRVDEKQRIDTDRGKEKNEKDERKKKEEGGRSETRRRRRRRRIA